MEEKINAEMFLKYFSSVHGLSIEDYNISPVVIGSWDHKLIDSIVSEFGVTPLEHWTKNSVVYNYRYNDIPITFVKLPVGAPSAVSTLEQLIACGAKTFIGIGFAGSLQPNIPVGSIIIADKCIREEGTSYHYLRDSSDSRASEKLLELLQKIFKNEKLNSIAGRIWTTDAIFRELKSKIINYGKCGVLAVEMETAAMYAVARYRGIDICNVLVISDELWDQWNPQFGTQKLGKCTSKIKNVLLNNIKVISQFTDTK
ncbi:nucleoside phosphorylase [Clostridium luticellarii]|jgi:uridine phosphorylase|uniref:Uridine phosphorylase n=1 Tax=Clostridium luticellarii TaxID=1691940 RepID=A0A2T0BPI8_9CLOT|nr:nucleoside phosphorylase [Clostridium luticellarii]MCI1945367.1 nucleoside phosphorylase [Clostridium luticellarii]MCI1968668.1 nucleoside phosphorylase [Clostridium luticellarii]MCI1996989.1 nucleoside phosphorylase [Clostridium luticellarii]MCI2040416.1 nucleoside phosphorylase [Clostridium luticellarii]PRR85790.1 Purine nucleoside phosphorylase DeoD-type [Clostridium luticellarii]